MKKYLTLILIFTFQSLHAQFWIAGDTTGFQVSVVETLFMPNATITFDIDCDGFEDFNINSSGPPGMNLPWKRLSFSMQDSVEVFNSNTGFITTFEPGDSIQLSNDLNWTEFLDFIYGTGELGPYGQYEIDEKYIAFRKKGALDTTYCYILFSNLDIDFTIHHIVSNCAHNPVEILTSLEVIQENNALEFYPNPASGHIVLSEAIRAIEIYTVTGRFILKNTAHHETVDLSSLNDGMYLIKLIGEKQTKIKRLFKR